MARGLIRVRVPNTRFTEGMVRRIKASPAAIQNEVAKAFRFGPGGFSEQFIGQASIVGKGSKRAWRRTKRFGTLEPPITTLFRSGQYIGAWLGKNAGSVFRVTGKNIQIGVDPRRFPQARVFQKRGKTTQRVTRKQRFFLGMRYGVWLREGQTITNHPRAFTMNDKIRDRAARHLVRWVGKGERAA